MKALGAAREDPWAEKMQHFGSSTAGTLSLSVPSLKRKAGLYEAEFKLEGSNAQAWRFELNALFASSEPLRFSAVGAGGENNGEMQFKILDNSLLTLRVPDSLIPAGRRGDGSITFVGVKQLESAFEGPDPWNEDSYYDDDYCVGEHWDGVRGSDGDYKSDWELGPRDYDQRYF